MGIGKLTQKFFQKTGLGSNHGTGFRRMMVIHAIEVKPSMNDVQEKLVAEFLFVEFRLFCGDVWTNQDFPVTKGEDICWSGFAEEATVNRGHFFRTKQHNT